MAKTTATSPAKGRRETPDAAVRCTAYGHRLVCCLLAICVLAACDRRIVYDTYRQTPVEGWEHQDTLSYHIDTIPATGNYRLHLGIRTSTAHHYPFRNLYLVVKEYWNAPDTCLVDTLLCHLTDEDGDLDGAGTGFRQYTFPVSKLTLTEHSTGTISVRHIMRRTELTGVSDIGIRLEKAD